MPRARSLGAPDTLRVRDLLLLSLFFAFAAALQQQAVFPSGKITDEHSLSHAAASAACQWRASDSLDTRQSGQQQPAYRDADVSTGKKSNKNSNNARISHNERALATVSPAPPAVRDAPATWSTVTAGGLSRQQARSLRDWQVEDLMLLATVDGTLHARDRYSGMSRWTLQFDREMVQTTTRANETVDENGPVFEDPLFIVEPSQYGSVYILLPGLGLQKLGYTVKELFDRAPYRDDGPPGLQYTAEKKTTLYTVDAATGIILDTASASGSNVTENARCKLTSGLEPMHFEECKTNGTLALGRTEYTVGISDANTKEQIITLDYFEWETNKRDQDLQRQHTSSKDNYYVYTKFDGTVYSNHVSLGSRRQRDIDVTTKPTFHQKFSSPVVRVFDVVRRPGDVTGDATLALLSQPVGPSNNDLRDLEDDPDPVEHVFVNCTEAGNWYALSDRNYPSVTLGASDAEYYTNTLYGSAIRLEPDKVMGVYHLPTSPDQQPPLTPEIEADHRMTIDPPSEHEERSRTVLEIDGPRDLAETAERHLSLSMLLSILVSVFLILGSGGLLYKNFRQGSHRVPLPVPDIAVPNPKEPTLAPVDDAGVPMLREAEPAQEIIFTADKSPEPRVQFAEATDVDVQTEKTETETAADADEDTKDIGELKKKKATRGKRGGRKQKEKDADSKTKRSNTQVLEAAEIISVAASESPQISGPLQINSLVIHTDRIIGQGSCGTIVFKGKFEGRDVAVKRMLSQYYELASQEVSFLQQSDDHHNVVRYYCQQKDDHFLYIAVELCQASLFEVWEADKAKTEARQLHLQSLKLTIQQDMTRTLQQLAAGLCHLHNLRIIHRDIKPQNILVGFPKLTQPGTRVLISDFGLGKNLPENVSTLIDPTGNAGTSGWKAPELISQPKESDRGSPSHTSHGSEPGIGGVSGVKRAADIFSLGCLFFWTLTDGVHPFEDENGWQQMRELNIKRGKKDMSALERWSDAYEPMQLITSMLEHQPEDRPTAQAVLNHPYFWSAEKRLAFLCDCSDHFEREPRGLPHEDNYAGDSPALRLLEVRAREVIGERADFLATLDKVFVDTLGKQRKYSGNRLLDLLRALRNKKNHYEDMPEEVKRRVGPLPSGYLGYWCLRFPRLLMACYEVVQEGGLMDCDRFKGYSGLGGLTGSA